MMLRCKLFILVLFSGGFAFAQTPPPPPLPPSLPYTSPTPEEQDRIFASRAGTIDELLYPLNYYQSKDEIYFETSDSLRAARKLRRAYILIVNGEGESVPAHFYTWYDKAGRPEQTASASELSADSVVHRWKYDEGRRVKCYITMTYEPAGTKGKWNYSGDSVLMKYSVTGQVTEIARYSVYNSGKARSSNFISKTTFVYDKNGWMVTKMVDGSKSIYTYNEKGKPVMVTSVAQNGQKFSPDSFAWRTGMFNDTVEHWAKRDWGKPLLIDRLIFNNLTGQESAYTLYPEEKENYIRHVYGPAHIVYGYDAGYRLVRRAGYTLEGVLRYEMTYKYDKDGFASGFQILTEHDPVNDPRPLPPAAQNFTGKVYVASDFNYSVVNNELIPSQMNYGNTLVGIKGESREILAHGNKRSPWKIVAEYYP